MRLIAAALAVALSCGNAAAQTATCSSHDKVLEDAKWALPNASHVVLSAADTKKLIEGLKRNFGASPNLQGETAIMFADPLRPNLLIVTFIGTCAKQMFAISPAQFEAVMKDSSI